MTRKLRDPPLGTRVSSLIEDRVGAYLGDREAATADIAQALRLLPPEIASKAARVLALPSYRDALIIQTAYGQLQAGLDLTRRQKGGRSVALRLGRYLRASHINGVVDALQNIGKNTPNLCRGNQPDFDDILTWASGAQTGQIAALFSHVAASTALTARPVIAMPELMPATLTFYRVGRLIEDLLARPSGGAHEQFAVAACIEALLDEFGQVGPNRLRIETKRLNASDLSSGAGGDIVVRRGNRPEEAFEISASGWRAKLPQAVAAISANDLPRAHVIADDRANEVLQAPELETLGADVSVIDVRAFLRILVAVMRKRARERALIRLYEHLARNQPDVELVNRYVELLRRHGVTA